MEDKLKNEKIKANERRAEYLVMLKNKEITIWELFENLKNDKAIGKLCIYQILICAGYSPFSSQTILKTTMLFANKNYNYKQLNVFFLFEYRYTNYIAFLYAIHKTSLKFFDLSGYPYKEIKERKND